MKKSCIFFGILLVCLTSNSFASVLLKDVLATAEKQMIAGRIRVQLEEVIICDKGIFVNFNGQLLAVEYLAADSQGLYCFFDEGDDDGNELWECSYCHTLNNMSRLKCKKCGTWR